MDVKKFAARCQGLDSFWQARILAVADDLRNGFSMTAPQRGSNVWHWHKREGFHEAVALADLAVSLGLMRKREELKAALPTQVEMTLDIEHRHAGDVVGVECCLGELGEGVAIAKGGIYSHAPNRVLEHGLEPGSTADKNQPPHRDVPNFDGTKTVWHKSYLEVVDERCVAVAETVDIDSGTKMLLTFVALAIPLSVFLWTI